ncbi:MAG: deoxyhypusine synthase [archaeon]
MKPIKHLKVKKEMKVSELVKEMGEIGFQAKKLSEAAEILREMIKDKECKIFLGLSGAMVPGGMKEVILDILDYTSVFVTNGANLTHDLIEALGNKHYIGNENEEDFKLNKEGINRIYNVYMKDEVYQDLEKFFDKNWDGLKDNKTIKEFLWKLGSLIKTKDSILRKCYENKIPIFCPALADCGIGLMIWGRKAQGKKIEIDAFEDMKEIIDFAWTSKKKGVFYINGGVPKNFIQQAMQFSSPASYGIQLGLDRVESGGSGGAPLKEGVSWGKMKEKARFVNVYCDATIALPLIVAGSFK